MAIVEDQVGISYGTEVRDYNLPGAESILALERGLADATWYVTPVPRAEMRELLVRKNGPAIKDTLIWFSLIFGSGYLFYISWGHWWLVFPYLVYSVLYASTSDSRWHESSHGTAFKSAWMNNVLYEVASFMVFRQSVPWHWSHIRHHSDTIIRGRDPEIAVPRPPDIKGILMQFFSLKSAPAEFMKMVNHAFGKIDPAVATYLPVSEYSKVFLRARIYLFIYVFVLGLSVYSSSILPLMFIGLPVFFGSWLMRIYGLTQHAGLAENVLDHRLNCRTVYMNRINRYLYWNMNYHLEHHMFPLVPYHALPRLHELIRHDCPKPYPSIREAYKEIVPTLLRQRNDIGFYARRELPTHSVAIKNTHHYFGSEDQFKDEWIEVCAMENLPKGDILRFDFREKTYAIYHTLDDQYYATSGSLRFNVRLSLPPAGLNCNAGVGSTYIFNLKPGDIVKAYGPFGDFHIKDSIREMVYVGGGAGMAPIMSHISYLFDTLKTGRKVSYWYGARSSRELFYNTYFEELASKHSNFSFHIALSEPLPNDNRDFLTGFIDQILKTEFLDRCDHPKELEYYLCGPPAMIQACLKVLNGLNVNNSEISYDEF